MALVLAEISGYLTLNGLPWLLLAWGSIYIFRPFVTIIHEFGHALGMIHEHQNPLNNSLQWNTDKVYQTFRGVKTLKIVTSSRPVCRQGRVERS